MKKTTVTVLRPESYSIGMCINFNNTNYKVIGINSTCLTIRKYKWHDLLVFKVSYFFKRLFRKWSL